MEKLANYMINDRVDVLGVYRWLCIFSIMKNQKTWLGITIQKRLIEEMLMADGSDEQQLKNRFQH